MQAALLCAAVAGILLAGCTTDTSVPTEPSTSLRSSSVLGANGCKPPSPSGRFSAEIQGTIQSTTARGGELWAWLMPGHDLPVLGGEGTKIVWKLPYDGGDPPHFVATMRDGTEATLDFGPQLHSGSSWARIGVEYGTSFFFPKPGCWDLHVTTGKTTGDVWIVVAARA
jgi:hypothetical protein